MSIELLKGFFKTVIFIDDGVNHGEIPLLKAREIATAKNLDIVKVSMKGAIPICKLMDYSKHKFDEKKSQKHNHSPSNVVKEMWISLNISKHDLEIKHNKIKEFLKKKFKVKYVVTTKERHSSPKEALDIIRENLSSFNGIGTWQEPKSFEKEISVVITPV